MDWKKVFGVVEGLEKSFWCGGRIGKKFLCGGRIGKLTNFHFIVQAAFPSHTCVISGTPEIKGLFSSVFFLFFFCFLFFWCDGFR